MVRRKFKRARREQKASQRLGNVVAEADAQTVARLLRIA
jgi:hypothetical protein